MEQHNKNHLILSIESLTGKMTKKDLKHFAKFAKSLNGFNIVDLNNDRERILGISFEVLTFLNRTEFLNFLSDYVCIFKGVKKIKLLDSSYFSSKIKKYIVNVSDKLK